MSDQKTGGAISKTQTAIYGRVRYSIRGNAKTGSLRSSQLTNREVGRSPWTAADAPVGLLFLA